MALKGGHCSWSEERERGLSEGLFTVKIRRGCSPGVTRLRVSKLSTHKGVKGSVGLTGNQEAQTLKQPELSSGMN